MPPRTTNYRMPSMRGARSFARVTTDLDEIAAILNKSDAITIYAGAGCAGAHDEVVATAARLKAPMAHTSRGKDFLEYDNPYNVGHDRDHRRSRRLSCHPRLRGAASARRGFRLDAVLSEQGDDHSDRYRSHAYRAATSGRHRARSAISRRPWRPCCRASSSMRTAASWRPCGALPAGRGVGEGRDRVGPRRRHLRAPT